jgi:hypothetical protein
MAARAEDGTVSYPYGPDAHGCLIYTPGGWMNATVSGSERASLSTKDPADPGNARPTGTNTGYVNFCGDYEVHEGYVVHHVRMSLLPDMIGTDQLRHFELNGDELILRPPPAELDGVRTTMEVRWLREE